MKKKVLSLASLLLGSFASLFATPIYTFENGSMPGDSWDTKVSIENNPSVDANNGSAKCLKATFTATWGAIATFSQSVDYSKYGLTFLVYLDDQGEVGVRAYDGVNNYELKNHVYEANKWTRVSFDLSNLCSTSNSIQIFTGSTNTIYVDDIELLPLSELENTKVECDETIIDYSYGTIAIGGGGFVAGIVASGNTKIARTDVGGAYKWRSSDCSWQPLTNFISEDDKGLLAIDGVAIDPQNENNIFLLGGCQYFSNQKTAIMYSNDGGKSFKVSDVSGKIYVHGNGNGRNCGERIAVDPNNSDIIYCGGRVGSPLIVSTDGGANWSVVSSFPSVYTTNVQWNWISDFPTTPDNNGTTSVVFDGSKKSGGKTQRIFVGISRTGASNVYVSENAGATWSAVDGLPTNLIPCRMKMDPDGNLLIAYSNACVSGTAGAIYRYNPNDKSAKDISPSNNYGFGDVAVSPMDANKLVVSTNNTWVPQQWDNGSSANGDIFWTSIDGGKTWRSLQNNMIITNNDVTWIPGYAIHWCGSVCFDPNDDNRVSFTSGNGIFTCNNIWCSGKPTFYFDVNGLEETVPLDLVSIPGGDLLSVIGDYTGFIHKDIHHFAPIHNPAPGTTGGINFYSKDHNVMMRVANSGFYCTTSGHNGWKEMQKTSVEYYNQYCPACGPMASNEGKCAITKCNGKYRFFVVPVPGSSGIFYSDNDGKSWTKVAGTEKATHIQVDPVDDRYVYVGAQGAFYYSSNYGSNFTEVSMSNDNFGRITIIQGREGVIYAPRGARGLAVSTNHGQSFNQVPLVATCEAVGAGKGQTDDTYTLFMWGKLEACDMGLYRSLDEGATWQRINDDAHQFGGPGNGQFVVGDWNVFGRVYMSSVGLGIIYGDIPSNATLSEWSCFVDETDCALVSDFQTIALTKGWNLVSLNRQPTDGKISELFDGLDVEVIKGNDGYWAKGQNEIFNSLTSLIGGEGYLIYMNKDAVLKVSGSECRIDDVDYSQKQAGWTLVGCPFQQKTPFANYLNSKNCVLIRDLNNSWSPDEINGIEDFVPGKAYFLKAK